MDRADARRHLRRALFAWAAALVAAGLAAFINQRVGWGIGLSLGAVLATGFAVRISSS